MRLVGLSAIIFLFGCTSATVSRKPSNAERRNEFQASKCADNFFLAADPNDPTKEKGCEPDRLNEGFFVSKINPACPFGMAGGKQCTGNKCPTNSKFIGEMMQGNAGVIVCEMRDSQGRPIPIW